MIVAALLIAAAAAINARDSSEHVRAVLLAVNEEAGAAGAEPSGSSPKIEHAPLEETPRNETVVIPAKVQDPSKLFAPLGVARKSCTPPYAAFTLRERGRALHA